MNSIRTLLSALLVLALPAAASAAVPAQNGDLTHGAALYRMHCASCHGPDARGGGYLSKSLTQPPAPNLRDAAFLLKRGDEQLFKVISEGGAAIDASFTMPAFGAELKPLDIWDLIAFVRRGQFLVTDFFPEAARYAAKTYHLDADRQRRLEPLLGKLSEAERAVTLVAVFKGGKANGEPVYVPQTPRDLDSLRPKNKIGYIACLPLAVAGAPEPVPTCVAVDAAGVLRKARVAPFVVSDADRARIEKLLSLFEGQGGKGGEYKDLTAPRAIPRDVKDTRGLPELAKALTRAYYRTLSAAIMFDKEELDRNPFD